MSKFEDISKLFKSCKTEWDVNKVMEDLEETEIIYKPIHYYDYADNLIGFCYYSSDNYIYCLCIHPEYQGIGLGTHMLKRAEEEGVDRLNCYSDLVPFYEKRGYTFIETFKRSDTGEIVCYMEKLKCTQ